MAPGAVLLIAALVVVAGGIYWYAVRKKGDQNEWSAEDRLEAARLWRAGLDRALEEAGLSLQSEVSLMVSSEEGDPPFYFEGFQVVLKDGEDTIKETVDLYRFGPERLEGFENYSAEHTKEILATRFPFLDQPLWAEEMRHSR